MKRIATIILAAAGICAGCKSSTTVNLLEPNEFIAASKSDSKSVILDVRRPAEFSEGHLAGAINLDWLDEENFMKGLESLDKSRTYYIYCRSGRRSAAAAEKMKEAGFRVIDMKGGILEWENLGMPVTKE